MSESARVRYMRLVLFFDLPVETAVQGRIIDCFVVLLKDGF